MTTKTDHEIYLEEFDLWVQGEQIRINELKRMVEDADKTKEINLKMLELAQQKLNRALASHQEYLDSLNDE